MAVGLGWALLAVALLLSGGGCEDTSTRAGEGCTDEGGDGGGGGDGDADSDGDADADADGDADVLTMDCSDCPAVGTSPEHLLCAIDLCDEGVVTSSGITALMPLGLQCDLEDTYEAVAHFGDPGNELAPKLNGSYALLATGTANPVDLRHSDDCSHYSANEGLVDPHVEDETAVMYDPIEWRLELVAPDGARGFRFKYVFFSEEYDDYISSPYNDKFYAILNAPITTGGQDRVINYTDCRDHFEYYDFAGPGCDTESSFCCYIAVNSALSDCCWYPQNSEHVDNSPSLEACPQGTADRTDISGTGFECAEDAYNDEDVHGSSTGWVQTSWPIEPGEQFTLTFHIHDTHDALWDSEVIIDAFEFLTEGEQGTYEIE